MTADFIEFIIRTTHLSCPLVVASWLFFEKKIEEENLGLTGVGLSS